MNWLTSDRARQSRRTQPKVKMPTTFTYQHSLLDISCTLPLVRPLSYAMSNAHLAGKYYTRFQAQKSGTPFVFPLKCTLIFVSLSATAIDNLLATQDATSTTSAAQEIQAVKKSLTEATTFLPPYDQRRYQDVRLLFLSPLPSRVAAYLVSRV